MFFLDEKMEGGGLHIWGQECQQVAETQGSKQHHRRKPVWTRRQPESGIFVSVAYLRTMVNSEQQACRELILPGEE